MRSLLLEFYRCSPMARRLLSIPRLVYMSLIDRCLSDEMWCRTLFMWSHGYPLDIDNPKTLNEKIQWLKLHNRKAEFGNWADKFKVRDYIEQMLGGQYLIPLLAVAEDPRRIDFVALPDPFIIKPTHSSGQTKIVWDKRRMNWPSVVQECRSWLKRNLYRHGREWHYKDIRPRIIVEPLLLDHEGRVPLDYKFHCFHGKIAAIQVDIDRHTNHRRRNFYDADWRRLPFTWSICAGDEPLWPQGRDIPKPEALPELVALTERVAQHFLYIRIDWYLLQGRIYFGEVTFHHGGGFERILPVEWDRWLGERLRLPRGE